MSIKKITATILCIAMLCTSLAACKTDSGDDNPGGGDTGDVYEVNFDGAYEKFEHDYTMIVSSDERFSANWELVYYFLCLAIDEIYSTTGSYPNLSDNTETGFRDQIITRATESIFVCLAIEYAASKVGATVSDDDYAAIALNQELAEEQLGGEDAFMQYLADNHASYEVYLYLTEIDYLYENTLLATYGEGAELFSDKETAAFIEDDEYYTVKQIFFSSMSAGSNEKLSDSEIAAKRELANDVLSQLDNHADGDFDELFDDLMFAHSEDTTALNMYPDGYLFSSGQAYQVLEDAAKSLHIGRYSDVLESEIGYHIIYRLPVNYDIIPQGYAWDVSNTLRSQAARDAFGQYVEDLGIELSEAADGEFYSLDLTELFK